MSKMSEKPVLLMPKASGEQHWVILNAANIVENLIIADKAHIDRYYTDGETAHDVTALDPMPQIGWTYIGTPGNTKATEADFEPPPAAPEPPYYKSLFTTQEFRNRYTNAEIQIIDSYENYIDASDTVSFEKMKTINVSTLAADIIDISNQNVIDAVNFEAQMNLITTARAAQILDPTWEASAGQETF